MKIIVSEIKEEGQDVDFAGEMTLDLPDSPKVPVSARVHVAKEGAAVLVQGTVRTSLEQRCSRCLNAAVMEMDFDFSALYKPGGSGREDGYHELRGEELEVGFYGNDEIDLADLIREQITVNLPIKPLCSELCKGMCPKCGANLNNEVCSCREQATDERWNVLNKLFTERKN